MLITGLQRAVVICRNCNIFTKNSVIFYTNRMRKQNLIPNPFNMYNFLPILMFMLRRQLYVQGSSLCMHTSASLQLVCFTSDHFFPKNIWNWNFLVYFTPIIFNRIALFFGELNGFLCSHMDNNYTSPNTNLVKMFNTEFTLFHTPTNVQIT